MYGRCSYDIHRRAKRKYGLPQSSHSAVTDEDDEAILTKELTTENVAPEEGRTLK